jgi:hypothetical protein
MNVKIEERGWAGHFICGDKCLFRRNTLLTKDEERIVVSTVGNIRNISGDGTSEKARTIGCKRYYETMAFHTLAEEIIFDSPWCIDHAGHHADGEANEMHNAVVLEIAAKMENGTLEKEQEQC